MEPESRRDGTTEREKTDRKDLLKQKDTTKISFGS
jgi:hypothetical protein